MDGHIPLTMIEDLLLGELRPRDAEVARRHLSSCALCAETMRREETLFAAIRDLPVPAPPAGIADAVLASLARAAARQRASLARRLWSIPLVRRPIFAAAAGGLCATLLALGSGGALREFGLLTGGVVSGWLSHLLTAVKGGAEDVTTFTVVVRHLFELIAKLESIGKVVVGAAAVPSMLSMVVTFAAGLVMASILARLFGPVRRESLSHVRQ